MRLRISDRTTCNEDACERDGGEGMHTPMTFNPSEVDPGPASPGNLTFCRQFLRDEPLSTTLLALSGIPSFTLHVYSTVNPPIHTALQATKA